MPTCGAICAKFRALQGDVSRAKRRSQRSRKRLDERLQIKPGNFCEEKNTPDAIHIGIITTFIEPEARFDCLAREESKSPKAQKENEPKTHRAVEIQQRTPKWERGNRARIQAGPRLPPPAIKSAKVRNEVSSSGGAWAGNQALQKFLAPRIHDRESNRPDRAPIRFISEQPRNQEINVADPGSRISRSLVRTGSKRRPLLYSSIRKHWAARPSGLVSSY